KSCHTTYVNQVTQEIRVNPKRFWSYVKTQKSTSSLPKIMSFNSFEYTSLCDIVRIFCKYFESVFTVHEKEVYPHCPRFDTPLFHLPKVTADEMKKEILSLDRFTCSGYDNVPVIFLIECASELCQPLSMIFNLSIDRGEYPTLLKFNNVVPIYKNKGDKSCVTSYRPISIQPVISKIFERIVNDALRKHLKLLICDEQHGFVPMKSTTTNLLSYSDFITKAFDDGVQVHTIYTDFHKAFDCVSHELLLYKMSNLFGIQGADLHWFRSYLSDRHQRVVMGGIESDWVCVPSGVPQGSILGPSLFIMYINDLPSHLQ
ncbi:MAG: reverse transcriptase family protein, partial [Pseudomonadota bacterium]